MAIERQDFDAIQRPQCWLLRSRWVLQRSKHRLRVHQQTAAAIQLHDLAGAPDALCLTRTLHGALQDAGKLRDDAHNSMAIEAAA